MRRALLFALAGALAANTRIIGFFVFGVMGITALVALIVRREMNKQTIVSAIAAVVGFAAIYTLITPAFLMNPVWVYPACGGKRRRGSPAGRGS